MLPRIDHISLVREPKILRRITIVLATGAAGAAAGALAAVALASAPVVVEAVGVAVATALAASLVEITLSHVWERAGCSPLAAAA